MQGSKECFASTIQVTWFTSPLVCNGNSFPIYKKILIPLWFGEIFVQNSNFAWKFDFWGKISWIVIEKLVKSSWDKIIWGKLLSTSAGMLFLYCNMSFWQVFYDEICICSMYSNNLAPIYYPTLIWQVFSTKNIGGKL